MSAAGLGDGERGGASAAVTQEPLWVLARTTVNLRGMGRDTVVVIDPEDADTRRFLQNTWLEILPAALQPRITVDTTTMQPTIHERDAMTVTLKSIAKVAVVGYTVEGETIEVEATGLDKKEAKNTGEVDLFYPTDFTGDSTITIQGSKPGSEPDTGTITIP